MAPLALRVDVRDVAAPRMVLLVHSEVHHKVHLVREVEGEAVALLIGGGWSSKLDAGLLVNGHLLVEAAGRSVHAVEHLGCGHDDSEEKVEEEEEEEVEEKEVEEKEEECVEVDDDNDEEEDCASVCSPPSCSST